MARPLFQCASLDVKSQGSCSEIKRYTHKLFPRLDLSASNAQSEILRLVGFVSFQLAGQLVKGLVHAAE